MSDEPTTYIPPMWLHNRAIVRRRGTLDPPFVLYRLRLGASREESSACLLAVEQCAEMLENQAETWKNAPAREAATITLPLADIEERFEATGKIMSVLRAPL